MLVIRYLVYHVVMFSLLWKDNVGVDIHELNIV